MPLSPGARIGVYEVIAPIGFGGMGEVYRARDTQLGRDVALKILPEAFASDSERLARFDREARTLATLNHANIAHIYGVETSAADSGSRDRALVMELVEGEDLAARLARGAIPIDDALPMARQIADALEAAHEQGIIHRDLKPANIKVRPDGTVKVLDFGLAKALEPGSGIGDQGSGDHADRRLASSPTITSPAVMTAGGMILGTAAYMSPEQAKGRRVDKRADIWAFGCVLYEMLSARKAFSGEDVTDTIVAVMSREPDWAALPADTPSSIRRLLRRCLAKNVKQRLPDIAAARLDIDDSSKPIAQTAAPAPATAPAARSLLPWLIAGASALAAAAMLVLWAPWQRPAAPSPVQLTAELGARITFTVGQGRAASVVPSPDGSVLAFVATLDGDNESRLYIRPLDQSQPTAVPGSEGAVNPFFSPDSRWVAFFAAGKLKKVAVAGGPVANICDVADGRGGAWADDGTIVFSPARAGVPLMRVSQDGGQPEPLTTFDDGDTTQRWPQVLPGSRVVLYTAHTNPVGFATARIVAQKLPNGAPKTIVRDAYYGRYLPSGHLLYVRDGTLFAGRFSLERLEIIGTAQPIIENVANAAASGGAEIAFSTNGTFVFVPGRTFSGTAAMQWVERGGRTSTLMPEPSIWSGPRFAPDGRQVAMAVLDRGQNDIWIYDWAADRMQRQTVGTGNNESPVWSPDGKRIVFSSNRGRNTGSNLFSQRADSSRDAQQLTDTETLKRPDSWHPDGRHLLYTEIGRTSTDVLILPFEGSEQSGWKAGTPKPFLNGQFGELNAMFSPDGRWVAYESDETGRYEVYVTPFPGPGPRLEISTTGGAWPTWSAVKPELMFSTADSIVAVPYRIENGTFVPGKAEVWAPVAPVQRGGLHQRSSDLHPDGARMALFAQGSRDVFRGPNQVTIIFNFFELLKRRIPS